MAVFLKRVEGVLTVGASSVPGEYLLPALMTGFHAQHPGVCARLRITDTAETIDDLRHGEVELGVVGGTLPDDDLVFEPLASDTLVLIVPATPEWKNRTHFTLRELRRIPLLVREAGSGTGRTWSAPSRSGRWLSPISTSPRSWGAWARSSRG